jgi:precorrin-6B methylase 2
VESATKTSTRRRKPAGKKQSARGGGHQANGNKAESKLLASLTSVFAEPVDPPADSPRGRDNRFYALLAGGARTRLLEGFLDLCIPELLGSRGPMTGRQICDTLALHPHRGWKFLHALSMIGLLDEKHGEMGGYDAVFSLSNEAREYFGDDGKQGYFLRELVTFWRGVEVLPFVQVLRGLTLPEAVRWPPVGRKHAEHLETWMRVTAEGATRTVLESGAMAGAKRLLDVGGGDGTIGCNLYHAYPDLDITVFNLPESAFLARQNIASRQCGDRVKVHEGDFLKDELPGGFDRIMFSRVLTDWTPSVCQMLFQKAHRALADGGQLIINEALVDGNMDYSVSWEFRYIFYDTFGRAMFKPFAVYQELLNEAGFDVVRVAPMLDDAFYSVIQAVPKQV